MMVELDHLILGEYFKVPITYIIHIQYTHIIFIESAKFLEW